MCIATWNCGLFSKSWKYKFSLSFSVKQRRWDTEAVLLLCSFPAWKAMVSHHFLRKLSAPEVVIMASTCWLQSVPTSKTLYILNRKINFLCKEVECSGTGDFFLLLWSRAANLSVIELRLGQRVHCIHPPQWQSGGISAVSTMCVCSYLPAHGSATKWALPPTLAPIQRQRKLFLRPGPHMRRAYLCRCEGGLAMIRGASSHHPALGSLPQLWYYLFLLFAWLSSFMFINYNAGRNGN